MEEALLFLRVDGEVIHTFSCSPFGLEELALGWLYDARRITAADDVTSVTVEGNEINVHTRNGLKPAQTLPAMADALDPVPAWPDFSGEDAQTLLQRLFAAADTFGCHAVGGLSASGELIVREDIGRHNAMDKVAGYFLKKGEHPRALVSTGRLSLDMTVKSAHLGASVVVTRKYPGTLSLRIMNRIGLRVFSGKGEEFLPDDIL